MKELYKSTEKTFLRIILISIIGAFVIEMFFGTVLLIQGNYDMKLYLNYLKAQCIIPTIISIAAYIGCYKCIDSPNTNTNVRIYVQILTLEIFCFAITATHTRFTVLLGLFILPIVHSGIYGNVKYIRLAMEMSMLGAILSISILFAFYDDINFAGFMGTAVGLCLLVAALPFALIVRNFANANKELLEQQIKNQINLGKQISIDAMTGLYNHTAFYDELEKLIKETDRTNESLCVAVVDIDNFKSVNDTYGHSRGDEVLIYLSGLLQKTCHEHVVCRYGGEEFAVIFKNCGLKTSAALMNEVLTEFGNHHFEWCSERITFSCGVCKHYDIRINAEELFKQADKYLYKAKKNGKNQVVSE